MTTWVVTRKSGGGEAYRYEAPAAIEFAGLEFATHDHTELVTEPEPTPEPEGLALTKLGYLRRFTQAERIAIRAAAAASAELTDYLELLSLAEDVRTDDPDTRAAVEMLEAVGLIAPGRAAEILWGA